MPYAAAPGSYQGRSAPPWGSLHGQRLLNTPTELMWVLDTYGVTPDETVITTYDTGFSAADASFVLRWLGFTDVRVHDEAWANWSRARKKKKRT